MASSVLPPSLLFSSILPFLATLASSATVPTTCYVLDGTRAANAGFRCNNATTGHSSCCAPGGVCYSNGVCQQSNGDSQDYLRVGCTDKTWKDPACLDQCKTFANDSTAGIRFCNGAITSTNQYCCDDGTNGIGSFACCNTASDIFAINPIATILAQIPLTYTSTSTSTSSSSSSSSTSTSQATTSATSASSTTISTPAASSSPPASENKGSSTNSAAIGAGVGVPVGLLLIAAISFFFWRHKKNAKKRQAIELENNRPRNKGYVDNYIPPLVEADDSVGVAERGNGDGKKTPITYFGGRQYDAAPQELEEDRAVHEMA